MKVPVDAVQLCMRVRRGMTLGRVCELSGAGEDEVCSVLSAVGRLLGRSAAKRGVMLASVATARPGQKVGVVRSKAGAKVLIARGWSSSRRDLRSTVGHVLASEPVDVRAAAERVGGPPPKLTRSHLFDVWMSDRYRVFRLADVSSSPGAAHVWAQAFAAARDELYAGRELVVAALTASTPAEAAAAADAVVRSGRQWAVPAPTMAGLAASGSPTWAGEWVRRVRRDVRACPAGWLPCRVGDVDEERWPLLVDRVGVG